MKRIAVRVVPRLARSPPPLTRLAAAAASAASAAAAAAVHLVVSCTAVVAAAALVAVCLRCLLVVPAMVEAVVLKACACVGPPIKHPQASNWKFPPPPHHKHPIPQHTGMCLLHQNPCSCGTAAHHNQDSQTCGAAGLDSLYLSLPFLLLLLSLLLLLLSCLSSGSPLPPWLLECLPATPLGTTVRKTPVAAWKALCLLFRPLHPGLACACLALFSSSSSSFSAAAAAVRPPPACHLLVARCASGSAVVTASTAKGQQVMLLTAARCSRPGQAADLWEAV